MPTVAPYGYEAFVEAAGFLNGDPVFALADGTLRFPAGGERVVEAHGGGITAARFDGFAERLLTGGEDGRVVATTGPEDGIEIASVGRRWVDKVCGGPNGAVGFASGRKAYAKLADGSLREIEHPRTVEDVAFAPKGIRLAVARYDGATLHYPAAMAGTPAELTWKGAHTGVDFSPDGRFLVTRMQENALHGWRLDDSKHMRMTGYPAKVKSWSWSARGRYLATSGAPAAILWPFVGKDGPMGKAPLELGTRGDASVTCVGCHPDEDMLAVGFDDGMILAVRFVDSREAVLRRGGTAPISAMRWDRGGRRLAFGSEAGEAGVVDLGG
jgi:WD40 repeat protein